MKIKVNDISVTINKRNIFSHVSFAIEEGQMVAITGESGCGKTTLLNALGLVQPVDCGEIIIDGNNMINLNDREKTKFWRDYATFIYQDYGIIEDESVAYNITLNKYKINNADVKTVLEKVGLANRDNDLAVVLSGGEKQRLGIARAIFKKASIIYADEPTASLDANNRRLVIDLLREFVKQGGIIILATHDEQLVSKCDKVMDMSKL